MRAVLGLLSVVLALAVIGVLVKNSGRSSRESLQLPLQSQPAGHNQTPDSGSASVREPGQQLPQQYRQQLESALKAQPPRAEMEP